MRRHAPSRYKFPALFLTTERRHAEAYAAYGARRAAQAAGYVYAVTLDEKLTLPVHRFGHGDTFGPMFRNLIHAYRQTGAPALHIRDVLDYPHPSLRAEAGYEIVVVFDLSRVQSVVQVGAVKALIA